MSIPGPHHEVVFIGDVREIDTDGSGAAIGVILMLDGDEPCDVPHMIAGHDLCSEQYGVSPARLTIVCGVGDAAPEWVCQRQGMIVSKLLQRPYPHKHNADHSCEASISRPVHA
jgi:hypothetical protein